MADIERVRAVIEREIRNVLDDRNRESVRQAIVAETQERMVGQQVAVLQRILAALDEGAKEEVAAGQHSYRDGCITAAEEASDATG